MKKIVMFSLLTCLVFAFFMQAGLTIDTYKVIKVNGLIVYKKTNKNLKQGDLFPENEQIVFKTADSKAAVISTAKGRFILAPGAEKKNEVKANLLPASSNISSRSGSVINLIDLQNIFTGKFVLLGKTKIHVNKDNFKMDDNNFFYLRFKYNGEDINKKLSFEGEKLIFEKESILQVDGKPIEKPDNDEYKLYYMKDGNSSQMINSFSLIMPNEKDLKSETEILLKEVASKSYSEKLDEFTAYMLDFYGKVQKSNASEWLKTNFALEP